jgi:hypothetical protein
MWYDLFHRSFTMAVFLALLFDECSIGLKLNGAPLSKSPGYIVDFQLDGKAEIWPKPKKRVEFT